MLPANTPIHTIAEQGILGRELTESQIGPRLTAPALARHKRLPPHAAALYPEFDSAMHLLKQLLAATRAVQATAQAGSQ